MGQVPTSASQEVQQVVSHLEIGHLTQEPFTPFPYTGIPELYPTRLTVTNSEIAILGIITQTKHGDLHTLCFSGGKYNNKLNNQTNKPPKKPYSFTVGSGLIKLMWILWIWEELILMKN